MIDYGKAKSVKIKFGNGLEVGFSKENGRFVEDVCIGFTCKMIKWLALRS